MGNFLNFKKGDKVVYTGNELAKETIWEVKQTLMGRDRGINTDRDIFELEAGNRKRRDYQDNYRLATEQEIKKDKLKNLFSQVG